MEVVISIAGSDPSAGAGIQQDLKAITAHGCYGATVVTALTVQNTLGVSGVTAVAAGTVAAQLEAVLSDLGAQSIKIGMIPNREVAEAVVTTLRPFLALRAVPVVYDPVMISTSGRRLMATDCVDYVCQQLFPLCTLVTPNLPETETLTGELLTGAGDIDAAGETLTRQYGTAFLLKGGHAAEQMVTDRLFTPDGRTYAYSAPRIASDNLHGTGCTLSSAIAANLAKGMQLPGAVSKAKEFVDAAIRRSRSHGIGHGNGPLLV